jgi:hypothetical protein
MQAMTELIRRFAALCGTVHGYNNNNNNNNKSSGSNNDNSGHQWMLMIAIWTGTVLLGIP